jgi:hypothetical protein
MITNVQVLQEHLFHANDPLGDICNSSALALRTVSDDTVGRRGLNSVPFDLHVELKCARNDLMLSGDILETKADVSSRYRGQASNWSARSTYKWGQRPHRCGNAQVKPDL